MKVYVPTPLRMYTGKQSSVEAQGATLAELFNDLDRQFPGMRFRIVNEQERIREHIKIFVNKEIADGPRANDQRPAQITPPARSWKYRCTTRTPSRP